MQFSYDEAFFPVIPNAISQLPLDIKLTDGSVVSVAEFAAVGEIDFTSSSDWLTIDDAGKIIVAENAPSGGEAVVTARHNKMSAELKVIALYSLGDTVESVAGRELPVVTNADSLAVMVNKQRSLPDGYVPADLTIPDVPYFFEEDDEKKYLQKPAAAALESLFTAAKQDGIELVAVSGYRSYARQKSIFEHNVRTQGEEEARRFSAMPGTSEHQTGLTMDISSKDFGNRLDQAFGETEAGKWVAAHAHEHGFIVRYLEGKEDVTGYAYEPWHLRYVGKSLAEAIYVSGLTMEEYFSNSISVLSNHTP